MAPPGRRANSAARVGEVSNAQARSPQESQSCRQDSIAQHDQAKANWLNALTQVGDHIQSQRAGSPPEQQAQSFTRVGAISPPGKISPPHPFSRKSSVKLAEAQQERERLMELALECGEADEAKSPAPTRRDTEAGSRRGFITDYHRHDSLEGTGIHLQERLESRLATLKAEHPDEPVLPQLGVRGRRPSMPASQLPEEMRESIKINIPLVAGALLCLGASAAVYFFHSTLVAQAQLATAAVLSQLGVAHAAALAQAHAMEASLAAQWQAAQGSMLSQLSAASAAVTGYLHQPSSPPAPPTQPPPLQPSPSLPPLAPPPMTPPSPPLHSSPPYPLLPHIFTHALFLASEPPHLMPSPLPPPSLSPGPPPILNPARPPPPSPPPALPPMPPTPPSSPPSPPPPPHSPSPPLLSHIDLVLLVSLLFTMGACGGLIVACRARQRTKRRPAEPYTHFSHRGTEWADANDNPLSENRWKPKGLVSARIAAGREALSLLGASVNNTGCRDCSSNCNSATASSVML